MSYNVPDHLSVNIRYLLMRLGITQNYVGFAYTVQAILLSVEQPERLTLATKWLFPDVAKAYHTNWKAVERDLRTVSTIAWNHNRTLLEELAKHPLASRPSAAKFIAILYSAFETGLAA